MPFIPHTSEDVKEILADLGVASVDQLFDEIPADLIRGELESLAEGLNEAELARLMITRAPTVQPGKSYLGAGAYEHHIPAAVWEIVGRGEFLTAYTPYQAEASQGSLQVIYEYQSMMAELMAMDVSNASLYDGATAVVEAILMALRLKRSEMKRVLVPATLNPLYRQTLNTLLKPQQVEIEELRYSSAEGCVDLNQLATIDPVGIAALVIPQPNYFGILEPVDALTDWAKQHGILVIAVVNPTAMALLKAPGHWGQSGADITCGEGQPLGVPLSAGGPYFGFLACKEEYLRQMPGRVVGKTVDTQGRTGFTLTLQTREQHIRRAKATSNICTNQGLVVTAATIYLSLLGFAGLQRVATASHQQSQTLLNKLLTVKGVTRVFDRHYFHEIVVKLPISAAEVIKRMAEEGYQAGIDLGCYYPELADCLLICATETKTDQDLADYHSALVKALQ